MSYERDRVGSRHARRSLQINGSTVKLAGRDRPRDQRLGEVCRKCVTVTDLRKF